MGLPFCQTSPGLGIWPAHRHSPFDCLQHSPIVAEVQEQAVGMALGQFLYGMEPGGHGYGEGAKLLAGFDVADGVADYDDVFTLETLSGKFFSSLYGEPDHVGPRRRFGGEKSQLEVLAQPGGPEHCLHYATGTAGIQD